MTKRRKKVGTMSEELIKTTVRFPESLWKAGRIRAIEEGRDFQEIVADALRQYLKKSGAK